MLNSQWLDQKSSFGKEEILTIMLLCMACCKTPTWLDWKKYKLVDCGLVTTDL